MIRADLGPEIAGRIAAALGEGRFEKEIAPDEVKAVLAGEIEKVLAPVAKPLEITARPFVILVAGVNGSGKTTTIGKLAAKFRAEGKSVMLVAGDTFRAAAIDQLKIWGERTGASVMAREPGADAAGLAFDALTRRQGARHRYRAGRYRRPLAEPRRADERTGKNGARHAQGRAGGAARGVAGARCDGRAERAQSGGNLRQDRGRHRTGDDQARWHRARRHSGGDRGKFGLPVHFIGVGEGVDDLAPFTARDFARAIVGLE